MDNHWNDTDHDAGSAFETCVECRRRFDMFDDRDNEEWYYGHDCEPDFEVSGCALCDVTEMHDHPAEEYGSFSESFFEGQEMRSIR